MVGGLAVPNMQARVSLCSSSRALPTACYQAIKPIIKSMQQCFHLCSDWKGPLIHDLRYVGGRFTAGAMENLYYGMRWTWIDIGSSGGLATGDTAWT